jgi:1-phosphofructokinase family hexose kinase
MFLIVNLNPAVDRIYHLKGFQLDKIHRTENFMMQAGGKGINVARATKVLKGNALVTGVLGGHAGRFISEDLNHSGLKNDFSDVRMDSRTCIILIDTENSTQTVINEDGPILTSQEIDLFIQKFTSIIDKYSILVISGSLPASLNRDVYSEIITIAKKNKVRNIVDTSKTALKRAIAEKPFMLKPNIYEIADALDDKTISQEAMNQNYNPLVKACKSLVDEGTQNVAVSMGKLGALFHNREKTFLVKAPEIKEINAVASGDSMTAAIAIELDKRNSFEEALLSGVAAGSANATVGGLKFSYEQYINIRKNLTVNYINEG